MVINTWWTRASPDQMFLFVLQVNTSVCVFIVSTYTDGVAPPESAWFFTWLHDAVSDFRYGTNYLHGLQYCVVGLGNSLYKQNYCKVSKIKKHNISIS